MEVVIPRAYTEAVPGKVPGDTSKMLEEYESRVTPRPGVGCGHNVIDASASSYCSLRNDQPGPQGSCIRKRRNLAALPIRERRPGPFFLALGRALRGGLRLALLFNSGGGGRMRHFIAYHNTENMGETLEESNPLRLLTNKPVHGLLKNTVWFVTGEGPTSMRQFSLGSMFRVTEVGDCEEHGFMRFASGPGHVFRPPVPIMEMEWFQDVLRATGNFAFGVQEVKDEGVIAGLLCIARQAGYEEAE